MHVNSFCQSSADSLHQLTECKLCIKECIYLRNSPKFLGFSGQLLHYGKQFVPVRLILKLEIDETKLIHTFTKLRISAQNLFLFFVG